METETIKKSKKVDITYKVNTLPSNRQKLSPQIQALVEAIELSVNEDGIVKRQDVLDNWSKLTKSEDNLKVFASHIHDLIQYDLLDKMTSVIDPKTKIKSMLDKMSDSDKAELIAELQA